MVNWYGIDGIEFHFNGPWNDPTITFEGVTDNEGVTVEGTMWERYSDEGFTDPFDGFEEFMRENSDEVKELILMARGEYEY